MIHGGPQIHSERANLNFDGQNSRTIGVGLDLDEHVETFVAVGLGVFDVVGAFDDIEAGLAFDGVGDDINIAGEEGGDADAGDIFDIGADIVDGGEFVISFVIFAEIFFDGAVETFDAAANCVNQIALG